MPFTDRDYGNIFQAAQHHFAGMKDRQIILEFLKVLAKPRPQQIAEMCSWIDELDADLAQQKTDVANSVAAQEEAIDQRRTDLQATRDKVEPRTGGVN